MQIIQMTKEERIAMYMKLSKREIAELLVNSNDALYNLLETQQPKWIQFPQAPDPIPCNPWQVPGTGDGPFPWGTVTCTNASTKA